MQSASTQAILKASFKQYLSYIALFFIINAFQRMGCEHSSLYFSWTGLLFLELSAPAVSQKSKNKWIYCNLVRLLCSCGAHSCSSVSYTSSLGLVQRKFRPALMYLQRKVLKQQPLSWKWGGNLAVLVKHIIKRIEDPFKSAAVLTSHGASTGYSCKDLDCEGIYNQPLPTNKEQKLFSEKHCLSPKAYPLFFPSYPLVCILYT